MNAQQFIQHLRQASPYIQQHRGQTFVLYIPGELWLSEQAAQLIQDLVLLKGLGIHLVLVLGAKPQIEAKLKGAHIKTAQSLAPEHQRITTPTMLPLLKAIAGEMVLEIQSQFVSAESQQTLEIHPISVLTGNWVTAQPLGIIQGIDHQLSGKVRRIQSQVLKQLLVQGHILLITHLAPGINGELYNLNAWHLAQAVAISLQADKWIAFLPQEQLAQLPKEMPFHTFMNQKAQNFGLDPQLTQVPRIHWLPLENPQALLTELFTRDGCGFMLHHADYDQIRPAKVKDLRQIQQLLQPLITQGILKTRPNLEEELKYLFVLDREGFIQGLIGLKPLDHHSAEVGPIVVHPDYQNQGLGAKLLQFILQYAKGHKFEKVYALSTQSQQWLVQKGFLPTHFADLPAEKQHVYDTHRNSQILVYTL